MNAIRNILAVVGIIAIVVGVGGYMKVGGMISKFEAFDPKAKDVYLEMMDKLLETGNPAEATVWRVKVEEDVSFDDVDESIRVIANERNIKNVGELPLWKQVESMTGKPQRKAKIYMFCNPLTAFKMMDFSDAYSAYLPCRISLIEDKKGDLWIYTLNMDMMIHGGTPLPDELKKEALEVKDIMLDVLKRAAAGDF